MLPVAAVPPDQKRMWHLCRGNGICVQLNLWLWRGVYLLPAPPPSPAIASSRGGQARWWNLPSRPLSALLFPNLSVRLCFLTLPHWPCLCLAINYRKHPLWNLSKYCRRINIQFIKNYIAGLQHYQCFDEFCCRWQLLFCDDCCWAWFDLFFFFFCGRSVGEEKDGGRGQIHAWMRRGSYLHAPLSPLHLTPHLWALWPMAWVCDLLP